MDHNPRCQQCDAPLTGQAVGGLCANCLLRLALEPPEDATAAADEPGDGIVNATAASREMVGSRIGRYKLLQEIGEGGFGIVYLADQMEPVKRRVALKVLKPGMDTREVVARFEAERQSLALMDHPHIARIFDGGATESGRPYFVMELVQGIPLTKYCDVQQLNTRQRLDLFLDVLAAVQHAHQKGIIHRDLKPSNILVSTGDAEPRSKAVPALSDATTLGRPDSVVVPVIKVIDFGIAKAISLELTDKTLFTAHGHMIGTPQYMSPEQAEINALDVDTRSDIYSLGVILYELLTGGTPLDAKKLRSAAYAEIQRLIREEEPPKPSARITTLGTALPDIARRRGAEPDKLGKLVCGDLDWIVMKAIEKDRSRRYDTANGFAADLRRHLENQPVLARPPGTGYLLSRFIRRHKFGFAAGAAVTLSLLGGIAAALWGMRREETGRKAAEAETIKTKLANEENKHNLHLASIRDYAAAVKALEEDFEAAGKSERAIGFAGKSRWHEGVVLLARSLQYDPGNTTAALRLFDTIRYCGSAKKDWSLAFFKYEGSKGSSLKQERVQGAVFSPDGTRIVCVSGDNTAQVREAATGRPVGRPLVHGDLIYSVDYSPDGTRIATASFDGTARMWNAETGEQFGEPLRPRDSYTVENSKQLTGANGGLFEEGELLRALNAVITVTFSPDGQRVFTVRGDGSVQLWNQASGEPLGEPLRHHTHPVPVTTSDFSPDGTRLATATTGKEGTVRVWNLATGQPSGVPARHEAAIRTALFSPDGSRFVTASEDRTARVWDTETGQSIGEPMRHEGRVNGANFSPDGSRIVTAGYDNQAIIWDPATGKPLWKLLQQDEVKCARFNADGSRIVTVSRKSAQVWDAQSGKRIGEPLLHDGYVFHARFSPDGTRVVTTQENQDVRVWDVPNAPLYCVPMRHPSGGNRFNRVACAALRSDGTQIVTVDGFNDVRLWDLRSCQTIGEPVHCKVLMPSRFVTTSGHVTEKGPSEGHATGVCFGPAGVRVAVTKLHVQTAHVWDAAADQAIGEPLKHEGEVTSVSFGAGGTLVATTGRDNYVRIWDAATGRKVGSPILQEKGVLCVAFSPDTKSVVTGGHNKTAQVWNIETGQPAGKPMPHADTVVSAEFSPDGSRVVTVTRDNTVRIWETASGASIARPMLQGGFMSGKARFSPDGMRIVSSNDRFVRIWDAASGFPLGEPRRHEGGLGCSDLYFTPDGTGGLTIGSGVTDSSVRLWQTVTAEEAKAIAAVMPEILTWAGHVAGLRFGEDGELSQIPDEERQAALTTMQLPSGPWAELARWFTTPLPLRALDLNSAFTPRLIAERERDFEGEGTAESLESALRYDPSVPLARLFLAAALEKADVAKEAKDREESLPQRAAFLRRYDLDALARETGRMKSDELAALWVRAANHLLGLPPDTKIGVGPKPSTAREEAAKAARKALELVPSLPAAEEVLRKL